MDRNTNPDPVNWLPMRETDPLYMPMAALSDDAEVKSNVLSNYKDVDYYLERYTTYEGLRQDSRLLVLYTYVEGNNRILAVGMMPPQYAR